VHVLINCFCIFIILVLFLSFVFDHEIVFYLFRRFTLGHLAQLKYILPEAIVLKKFLVHDERTCCMKPDIHISLNPEAVEAVESDTRVQRRRVSLKKLFQARLRDFLESHPDVSHIQTI